MLHDLEELVLKCRDDRARAYIGEAVGCYRAGSYRAAIVATWIAVAFDIIDKIHELSLSGDKAAESLSKEFEGIRKSNNLGQALAFERNLLTVARDAFELISAMEYQDLNRIQEDRHRCAHPSHTGDSAIFTPSPELARLHIRSAVEILLMHEPAQGRAALEGLLREINSRYFPTGEKEALKILDKGPLKRARPSLVRNLLLVIIKSMLEQVDSPDYRYFMRHQAALLCIKVLHLDIWRKTLEAELSRLFRGLSDDALIDGCKTVMSDDEIWAYLDVGQQSRVRAFVRELPTDKMFYLDSLLVTPVAAEASVRIARMSVADFEHAMFLAMPEQAAERLISVYATSKSFDEANAWARIIQTYVGDLTVPHVARIIKAAGANGQILGSFQLPPTLAVLRKSGKFADADFNSLLQDNGLAEYIR